MSAQPDFAAPPATLSSAEKAAVRAVIFNHLSGIALGPVIAALADRGVVALLMDAPGGLRFDELAARTHANRGYFRVALRLLRACGWMSQSGRGDAAVYALTQEGRFALPLAPLYNDAVSFIPKAIFLDDFLFGKSDQVALRHFDDIVRRAKERWTVFTDGDTKAAQVHRKTVRYIEGLLVGPAMVALAREGVFARLMQAPDGLEAEAIAGNRAALDCVYDLLELQGWLSNANSRIKLTNQGRYAAQIAASYGVTVSYLPLFERIGTLLFGNVNFPRIDESGGEILVNRGMNVWGSGGAHSNYFKKIDEFLIELFNRPLGQQPSGVCDMGCGDGTLLRHVYETVRDHTARGAMLDAHPLVLVGVDFNKVARRISKQNLRKAGVPNVRIIPGDINRPAYLAAELENLDVDIHELLHVRSFLDHNRPYLPPANYPPGSRAARTEGAFAALGAEVPADELEENLVRHLRRWAPYVGRFGLLVLELHTLAPRLIAANLDHTLAIAYDATHGFSDQYLVEFDVFQACAREAGLLANERFCAKFPPGDLATISINFFEGGKGKADSC
jgi:SAM-dependent methyltransferase